MKNKEKIECAKMNARLGINYRSKECKENYEEWSKKVRSLFKTSNFKEPYDCFSYVTTKSYGYLTLRTKKPRLGRPKVSRRW